MRMGADRQVCTRLCAQLGSAARAQSINLKRDIDMSLFNLAAETYTLLAPCYLKYGIVVEGLGSECSSLFRAEDIIIHAATIAGCRTRLYIR